MKLYTTITLLTGNVVDSNTFLKPLKNPNPSQLTVEVRFLFTRRPDLNYKVDRAFPCRYLEI